MAKKLTSAKAKKILHDKTVHGKPLTDKQRKFFGAIAGGAEPYQLGGYVYPVNYVPQAQNGIEGTMGGLTDVGFNYNGAWGGPSMQNGGVKSKIKPVQQTYIDNTYVKSPVPLRTKKDDLRDARTSDQKTAKAFLNQYYNWAVDSLPFYHDLSSVDSFYTKREYEKKNQAEIDRIQNELNAGLPANTFNKKFDTLSYRQGETRYITDPSLKALSEKEMANAYQQTRRQPIIALNTPDAVVFHAGYVRGEDGLLGQHDPKKNITDVSDKDRLQTLIHERAHKADMSKRMKGVTSEGLGDFVRIKNYDLNDDRYLDTEDLQYLRDFSERQARHRSTQYWLQKNMPGYNFKNPISQKEYDFLIKNQDKIPSDAKQLLRLYGDRENFVKYFNRFQDGGSLPGATGMMYARVGAPSNGPYAKKTKASAQNGMEMKFYQEGLDFKPKTISKKGSKIKKDNMGYWNPENWGEPVEIDSNEITMQGVYEPLIGISDTGDVQYMEPGEDYTFDGSSVVEYPLAANGVSVNQADQQVAKHLDQLTNFTNYNKMAKAKKGKKLTKAQIGSYIGGAKQSFQPVNYSDIYDQNQYNTLGTNRKMQMEEANLAAQQQIAANSANKGGINFESIVDNLGKVASIAESLEYGGHLKKAQNGNPGLKKFNQGLQNFGKSIGKGYDKVDKSLEKIGGVTGGIGIGKDLAQGFEMLKQEKEQQKQAKQFSMLSGVTRQAAESRPEVTTRKYVRPEDTLVQPGQLSNPYGTGGGFLQDGGNVTGMIGGNPTEIQNVYNPGDIYSDLGYIPVSDNSQNQKQYRNGGKAQFGDKLAGDIGGTLGSLIGGGKGRPTAGGKIGSTIGSTVGKFVPIPGASAILGGVGGLVGGIFGGKAAKKTEDWNEQGMQNMQASAFQQGAQAIQAQNSAYMEDGGELKYLSHDWQPQVIAKFGDYDVKDLLAPPKDADMLRAGGQVRDIRSNYMGDDEKLSMMQMGGELQTYWGGDAETISENPYLPDGGETIMFRGQSHDESDGKGRTGIGITFGDNPVEVERGEPAVKLRDGGTGDNSLIVFGNMKIPSYGVSELDDPKAKGKKFKHYAADLSKVENKANKITDKALKLIDDIDGDNPFDVLKLNTGKAMLQGADASLKEAAYKKNILAGVQNAILDTAEEMGLESDALSKGKIKPLKNSDMAKFGAKMEKAQKGKKKTPIIPKDFGKPTKLQLLDEERQFRAENPEAPLYDPYTAFIKSEHPYTKQDLGVLPTTSEIEAFDAKLKDVANKKKFDWETAYQMASPYLRPLIQNPLDPNQLMGEQFMLATNQLEPVQAQGVRFDLGTPQKISLDDRRNQVRSAFASAKRAAGTNPAAQAAIAAQEADALNQIGAEEFRINQGEFQRVTEQNRELMRQQQLQNLGIFDRQYERQATAKSKTKAQAYEALSSIADKIARNKAETLQANVMANMYPQYTFGPKGRIFSTGLTTFNTGTVGDYSSDELQKLLDAQKVKESKGKKRNGSIVKAFK